MAATGVNSQSTGRASPARAPSVAAHDGASAITPPHDPRRAPALRPRAYLIGRVDGGCHPVARPRGCSAWRPPPQAVAVYDAERPAQGVAAGWRPKRRYMLALVRRSAACSWYGGAQASGADRGGLLTPAGQRMWELAHGRFESDITDAVGLTNDRRAGELEQGQGAGKSAESRRRGPADASLSSANGLKLAAAKLPKQQKWLKSGPPNSGPRRPAAAQDDRQRDAAWRRLRRQR